MEKRVLTEEQIRNIVAESVKNVLNELSFNGIDTGKALTIWTSVAQWSNGRGNGGRVTIQKDNKGVNNVCVKCGDVVKIVCPLPKQKWTGLLGTGHRVFSPSDVEMVKKLIPKVAQEAQSECDSNTRYAQEKANIEAGQRQRREEYQQDMLRLRRNGYNNW